MKSKKITTVKPEGRPASLIGRHSSGIEPPYNAYYMKKLHLTKTQEMMIRNSSYGALGKDNTPEILVPGDKVHFMNQILTLKNQDPRFLSWEFEEIDISPVEYSNNPPPVKVSK